MSEEELLASIAAMLSYKETRDRLEQEMREQMPWLAQKILNESLTTVKEEADE